MMTKAHRGLASLTVTLFCSTVFTVPALATPSPGPAAPAAPAAAQNSPQADSGTIEDIIVTARKRAESLQTVPIAITAATGEQLRDAGIHGLADLGRWVPGLRPQPHPSAASIVQFILRGQSAGDVLQTVDQAVGVYLDGVYVARTRGLNGSFFDVERVEVLKGPQGTLYGRNTTGGAVSIITKGADYNGLHGFIGFDAGDHRLAAGRAALNIPIIDDKLAIRVAGQHIYRRGFGSSANTGQDLGQDRNQYIGRVSILATPTDRFTAEFKAEYYQSQEHGTLNVPIFIQPSGALVLETAVELTGVPPGPTPAFGAAVDQALARLQQLAAAGLADPYTTYTDYNQIDNNYVATFGGTLKYDFSDNVSLKSITGYRQFHAKEVFDLDGTPFDGLEVGLGETGIPIATGKPGSLSSNFNIVNPDEQRNHFFSEELNLSGQSFGDRLNWLLGGYYSNESGRDIQVARAFPALVPLIFLNDGYKVINKSWSVFAQADLKIVDRISVTGGVRYTEEQKALVSRLANFFPSNGLYQCGTGVLDANGQPLITTNPANCQTRQGREFTGVSYLGSLNFQATDDILVYLKTAKGFRGGAFQLRSPTLAPAGPETATEYEIGVKSDLFDRHVRLNLAGYITKYNNKQESIIVTTPSGSLATVIQNAANATLKGFEAELTARPIAGLTLGANLAYIEGKYDSFPDALPIQGGTPVDATGERFSIPPWAYSITGRYETQLGPGVLGFEADWAFSAGARPPARLLNPTIPAAIIDQVVANVNGGSYANGRASLGLLNGRINYHLKDADLDIAVFVTNATNKKYFYSGIDPQTSGQFVGITGAPRMIGVTLRKGFGRE